MPGEKIIWISEYKEVIPAQRFKGFFHISNKMRCVSISILSSEPKTEKVGNQTKMLLLWSVQNERENSEYFPVVIKASNKGSRSFHNYGE